MNYKKVVEGTFLSRPNRFIAHVLIDGQEEVVHVKNTGRCKELLQDHATVYLADEGNLARKTRYDLIAVEKNGRMINMDSQAPNQAVKEWIEAGNFVQNITYFKPEFSYGDSRFDFYVESGERQIFLEVKGVTLEQDSVVSFPDAPSERAIKHLKELESLVKKGYEAYVLFVIQMNQVSYFLPNRERHPEFAKALESAAFAGVKVLAYDTIVTKDSMEIQSSVPVFVSATASMIDSITPLMKWYEAGHRSLPWRENPSPYYVWLSEIMLQQTRVEAVKPYFKRFLEKLPTIEALANAEEEVLLKLWEGLGYYNRVRNLQKAACQIQNDYSGQMPSDWLELQKLSGIGSYTAGAIASIAFGQRAPAVDGNVLRIFSRLLCIEEEISNPEVKKQLERQILEIIPEEKPGEYNQALMELGAMVCLPNGMPKCEICPWERLCKAHAMGVEQEYPKKAPKKDRSIEKKTILLIQDAETYAVHKRPPKGLLASLYEFPSLEGHKSEKAVVSYLKSIGLQPLRIQKLENAKHIFTHKEWHMLGYKIQVDELSERAVSSDLKWIFVKTNEAQEKYPLPSAFRTYTDYLQIRQGKQNLESQ
ncbi:MAG: A/G-specific adenine glycosylase [Lachnospiraceae bacterium]|nr:A/G-specific adenine glycosylase [Lachnospiraceae bacterium]